MLLLPRSPAGKASRARRTLTQCRRWRVRSSGTAGCRSGPRRGRQGRGNRAFGHFFNVHGPTTHATSLAPLSGRQATRASPLRGHHPDARSGRRRRADKADTSSEDGRHRWRSRATPLGVVAASTWLPHTVRRPDLALKSHRPCEAHEGSSGHVTMRDRRAYYLSRPPTA